MVPSERQVQQKVIIFEDEVGFDRLVIGTCLILVNCFAKAPILVVHQFIPRIPYSVKFISADLYSPCAVSGSGMLCRGWEDEGSRRELTTELWQASHYTVCVCARVLTCMLVFLPGLSSA